MNNPNPFLPQSSYLEQKNKARARLRIVVLLSISLSVMVLMVLLVQGCRKNDTGQSPDQAGGAPTPEASNPTPDTNNAAPGTGAVAGNPGTLPPPPIEPSNTPPPPPPPTTTPPEPATSDYVVVKGDTLDAIHKKTGVSVRAIEDANPGVDPKRLKIGQKLHIPAATSPAPAGNSTTLGGGIETPSAGGEQTYKVKSGDTLDALHKKFHVSIKAIQSANNLKTTSIRVGQTLKIPSKAAPEVPPTDTAPPPPASTPTMPPPTLQPATPTNH